MFKVRSLFSSRRLRTGIAGLLTLAVLVPAQTVIAQSQDYPSVPTLYVTGRNLTSIDLAWTNSGSATGVKHYEVIRNNQVISITGNTIYSHTGLSCGTTHSYAIRVTANNNKVSSTGPVTTTTRPCPTSSSSSSSSSSNRRPSSSSNSTQQPAPTTPVQPNTPTTLPGPGQGSEAVPETEDEEDTLGSNDNRDDRDDEESSDKTEDKKEESNKGGLSNLEKIIIGILALAFLVGIMRFFYVRQVNKQTNYWS